MPVFITESELETSQIAGDLARRAQSGDVFLLSGPLGAGKSVFARGFIRALCGNDTDVPSPTFTLVQTYDAPTAPVWHLDLYRLKNPEEIFEIGWEDSENAIRLIEWPERLGPYVPRKATNIMIEAASGTTRKITIDEL